MLDRLAVHADEESFDIGVERSDDESASVRLFINVSDAEQIVVTVGRYHEHAEQLVSELESALKQARDIVDTWKDVPDSDSDAFVYFDSRDGYIVSLEGLTWNGSMLKSYQRFPDRSWRTFPTRDIATYELARAMSHAGCFPNAWYQDERGWHDDINADVRKYHDAGGDKMLPLEGVEYAQSEDVTADGLSAYIDVDYGTLGIIYILSGDDERRFTDDRSIIFAASDEDE